MKRLTVLSLAVGLALATFGCAQKTVNDVLADPGRYAQKEISMSSRVSRSPDTGSIESRIRPDGSGCSRTGAFRARERASR